MDKSNKNNKKTLNSTFTQIFLHLAKSMKDITDINNESYNKGKKEGLEEIINWVKTFNNGDLKYIPATSFISMLYDRSKKSKAKLSKAFNDEGEVSELNEEKQSSRGKKKKNNYKFTLKLNEPSDMNLFDESLNLNNLTSNNSSIISSNSPENPNKGKTILPILYDSHSIINSNNLSINQQMNLSSDKRK